MNRPLLPFALPLACAALLALPAAVAAPPATPVGLLPRDAFALAGATDVRISRDGRTIAYVRTTQDIMTDAARSEIWLIDTATGAQTPLGAVDAGTPRWSPDGRRLAYVGKAPDGTRQLFVRWLATGTTTAITTGPEAPGDPSWSPGGDRIAFSRFVPQDGPSVASPVEKPEGAKWAPALRVIDRPDYRLDDAGYARAGHRRLFVVPADGGAARPLTDGDADDGGPLSWSPDGRRLYFASNHALDRAFHMEDTEVFSLDLDTLALTRLTDRRGPDDEIAVSPDGRHIAFTGYDNMVKGFQDRRLYVMNADGSGRRALTVDLDRDVRDPAWSGDGRSLFVHYEDRGRDVVALVRLDGRRQVVSDALKPDLSDRPYAGGTFSVARDGTVAFAGNLAARPPEVVIVRGGRARTLTDLNATLFAGKTLAEPLPLAVRSPADGRPVDAWMLLPPGYDPHRRYPAILEIHGGPYSAYGPNWSTSDQLYAQAGYVVLYGNPRGSTSYGDAFANLIQYDYPSKDYDDLMGIVDAAIARGAVDPDNLFVTGGSGGGLLTTWIVSRANRFRAAMAQKPVINWLSETLTSDAYPYMANYWFRDPPWKDPMTYWRLSPISRVGEITTPTAVMVGEEDLRTPPSEAEQLFDALSLRHVPTRLIRVPGASHESLASRPSQLVAEVTAILDWFGRYRTPTR